MADTEAGAEGPSGNREWTRPGASAITAGVWRIPLPLPVRELGHVNCYLFTGTAGAVLIDPGWATAEGAAALESALASIDLGVGDVSRIVATHTHWDHYSHAIELRASTGVPIGIGTGERDTVEAYSAGEGFYPRQAALLKASGAARLAAEVLAVQPEAHEVGTPFGRPDEWLEHGATIPLGDRDLTVWATPGHTRGSVVFEDRARRLLVTGDHVLPRITPSTGLEYRPEAFPLRSFLSSLAFVRTLPDADMLPAHGAAGGGVHQRAAELLQHHDERLDAVLDAVRAGSTTAFAVAEVLRWTRRARRLDELPAVHRMTAVLEVAQHLDVLEQQGRVQRGSEADVVHFTAA